MGLVPLRATAVDYRHVTVGGRALLAHQALLEELPESPDLAVRRLQVAGVAEEGLFWRDIRRVLFSHARYRVLGRLGRDGVQEDWSPVKLVDILREVAPDMAKEIDYAGQGPLAAMQSATAGDQGDHALASQQMRGSLVSYAGALAAHYDKTCTEHELSQHGLPTQAQCDSYATLETQRAAFAAITERLERTIEIPNEPLVIAQLRSATLAGAGIGVSGAVSPGVGTGHVTGPVESAEAEPASRYLDAEMVAIYW